MLAIAHSKTLYDVHNACNDKDLLPSWPGSGNAVLPGLTAALSLGCAAWKIARPAPRPACNSTS